MFVYTGESEKGGLIRALNQPILLHENYAKKQAKQPYYKYYAQVYERTLMTKHGLYLMLVRNSDDYDEIKTSEYKQAL